MIRMKKSFLFVAILATAMLAGCAKVQQPDQINVNPSPLTVVGNKVTADITGTFPAKKFAKKGVLTVTPVLKYDGGEALAQPVTYVGEKAKENGKVVNYKNGGKYSQTAVFDYIPAMEKAELYLRCHVTVGSKSYDIPDFKVADGVVTTSTLAGAKDLKPAITPDKFQRVIQEIQAADIKFLIQQANLRQSELKSQEMKDLLAAAKDAKKAENKEINKVEVKGYASPDGGMDLNEKLAKNREKNAENYLKNQLKRQKINNAIESEITAEDWEGFQKAMENSNIADKNLVLRVLSMYSDPEEREAQIKNLSAVYKTIAVEILPALRRSRLQITTDIIGKSDDEIKALAKEDAKQLNVEELLYAATLFTDRADIEACYAKCAEIYADYRACNNWANLYLKDGNLAKAKELYLRANQLKANDPDVNYNLALIAMYEGNLAAAEANLGKAVGTKANLSAALGTLNTMKGDYKTATTAYGNEASNNAAVQHILNEDYAQARKVLNSIEKPNSLTYYLKAIVGARTNDRDAVLTNLKTACQDAELKAYAKNDIEFAKYAELPEYQAIVK